MHISVNMILCNESNNHLMRHRVLWIDEGNYIAYLIDIDDKKAVPFKTTIAQLEGDMNSGNTILEIKEPYIFFKSEEELSSKEQQVRDFAWELVSGILSLEPQIYSKSTRGGIVSELVKSKNCDKNTIYKYLRKYWQRGMNKNALIPDYRNSGARGKCRKVGEKKVGRPRKNKDVIGEGHNVSEEWKSIFRVAIKKYYETQKENALTHCYEQMVKNYFNEDVYYENGIKKVTLKSTNELPTLRQFSYWYKKEQNVKSSIQKRKSKRNFELNHRAVLGNSMQDTLGPGSKYQIDATIGDVYLVSSHNREWVIGRPVIYCVIDIFSRMVVGLYVGLEGPSWNGAMMALSNCVACKVDYCKDYDIEIEGNEWPVQHLPDAILADRGEMKGKAVETLTSTLKVRIENTPPYRADWKGIVERHFRTMHGYVKPFVPGFVEKDYQTRGARNYALDGKLNLREFTQIIIRCVLAYNKKFLSSYIRDEMMIEEDITPTPLEIWNWGVKNRSGVLRYFPEEIVKLNLLPRATATITYKGIKFKNNYYGCETALKEHWFETARNKGSWKEEISYDPRDISEIYMILEQGRSYLVCTLLNSQQRNNNKSEFEVDYLNQNEVRLKQRHQHTQLEVKADLNNEIEHIINQVIEVSKEEKNAESDNEKINNIRERRKLEKEANRVKEKFELSKLDNQNNDMKVLIEEKEFGHEVPSVKHIDAFENVEDESPLSRLKRMQKEKLNGKIN